MRSLATGLLILGLPLALVGGCESSKSANPLSPSVAGPIAGVSIQAPKPVAPAAAAQIAVDQQPLALTVENASSTGVRPLSYIFEIAMDAGFTNKILSQTGVQPNTGGRTSLRLTQSLQADNTYYWRAKADDGANASDYSAAITFRVYTPVIIQAPVLSSPADNATLTIRRPTLTVVNALRTGPAGAVQYLFEAATDSTFATKVISVLVNEGSGQTTYTATDDLAYATRYYWRVKASDPGHTSPYSNTQSFVTPAAPVVVVPAPPPNPPNPPRGDQIDMSQADIINNPPDLASWAVTTSITNIDFSTGYMMVDFDQRLTGRWPESDFGVEYTLGLCFFLQGGWHCSAVIQFWTGRDLAASGPANQIGQNWYYGRWGIMDGHQPAIGEMVGVFVAQGNLRDRGQSTLHERSNVVLIPFGTNYVK